MNKRANGLRTVADCARMLDDEIRRRGPEMGHITTLAGIVFDMAEMLTDLASQPSETATVQKDHPVLLVLQAHLTDLRARHVEAVYTQAGLGPVVLGAQVQEVERCIAIVQKALGHD